MDSVYQAPGHPRLRIALHYGPVQTDRRGASQRTVIVGGDAILCAARVEPLVEPGQIWATEDFRQQFLERPSLWRTTAVQAPMAATASTSRSPARPSPTPGCASTGSSPERSRRCRRRRPAPRRSARG
jgi:class 3 adenylate cyclase